MIGASLSQRRPLHPPPGVGGYYPVTTPHDDAVASRGSAQVARTSNDDDAHTQPADPVQPIDRLLWFLIPTAAAIFFLRHDAAAIIEGRLFIFLCLVVYTADLAALSLSYTHLLLVAAVGIQSLVSLWCQLLRLDDDNEEDHGVLVLLAASAVETIYYILLALAWLSQSPSNEFAFAAPLLHSLVPPVCAALNTAALTRYSMPPLAPPLLFAGLFGLGRFFLGNDDSSNTNVRRHSGRLLRYAPLLMYLPELWRRRSYPGPTASSWCDLLLVVQIPFWLDRFLSAAIATTTTKGTTVPPSGKKQTWERCLLWVTALTGAECYLRPVAHRVALLAGTTPHTFFSFHAYSTLGLLSLYAATSETPLDRMVGAEYQEDLAQLLWSLVGLAGAKALGLPWSMTPLPILGLLGGVLWLSTRMLRYWLLFLFTLHAAALMLLHYRFVGLPAATLRVLHTSVPWVRGATLLTGTSGGVCLVVGLALRASGGVAAGWMRRSDVTGGVLLLYTLALLIWELALLSQPPLEDDDQAPLYGPPQVLGTSVVLVAMVLFLWRLRLVKEWSASVTLSLALGKAVAVYSAAAAAGGFPPRDDGGTALVVAALSAALLSAVLWMPRIFVPPVHRKTGGRVVPTERLPPHVRQVMAVYALGVVPLSLCVTLPYVVVPFMNAVASHWSSSSYSEHRPLAEYIGAAVSLWGLSVFTMLQHYLPDGGAEVWKKTAALAFCFGIGVVCATPALLPPSHSSPYAPWASWGAQLLGRRQSRTGGWGLLAAATATLLAASGPLELRERRSLAGRKDRYLFLRTLLFSVLFGGGVAWFIVVQCMSEADWVYVLVTLLASSLLAFLGTVAAVLGYFVELDHFDEVQQMAQTWWHGLLLLLPMAGLPYVLRSDALRWFSSGGWLVPYLVVGSLSALAFALSLRHRPAKDTCTRGLGNLACVISWILATIVLYGRFGVSDIDVNNDVSTLLGIPNSVLGTLALSGILWMLEGETSPHGRVVTRVSTSHRNEANSFSSWRLSLPQLTSGNRWFPMFAGSVIVFLCVSLHCTLLRGFNPWSVFGTSDTKSEEDLYAGLIGFDAEKEDHVVAKLLLQLGQQGLIPSMFTVGHLSTMSIWTSRIMIFPFLNLIGVACILPNFRLLMKQYWWNERVTSSQVSWVLPLNFVTLLLCNSLPSMVAATLLILAGSITQYTLRQRDEYATRMRI